MGRLHGDIWERIFYVKGTVNTKVSMHGMFKRRAVGVSGKERVRSREY